MTELPTAERVDEARALLKRMSLNEKAGQMTQLTLEALCVEPSRGTAAPGLDLDRVRSWLVEYGVGSVLNVYNQAMSASAWRDLIGEIQAIAVQETRLGIPILYGIDAVHGAGYTSGTVLFPHQLALAASWNPALARVAARETAFQMLRSGIPWTFAPVLDLGRNPAWSRIFETYGEDAFLAAQFGKAAVQGYGDVPGVASCAKHFLGYSVPASGRDRTTAWIPEHELRERHVPPFAAALAAGADTVMLNSGIVNGQPVHASKALITDLLRRELGFDGVVVSDWEDVVKLHTVYRVADSVRSAVQLAVQAGLDLSMAPFNAEFADHVVDLVRCGEMDESVVDRSVLRILQLKMRLGLFDRPVPTAPEPKPASVQGNVPTAGTHLRPSSTEYREPSATDDAVAASRRAARQSLVLLENQNNVLPLSPGQRIKIVGEADHPGWLLGPWSRTWQGSDAATIEPGCPSLRESLRTRFGARIVEGSDPSDIVLLVAGSPPSVEKPGDIDDLALDDRFLAEADAAGPAKLVLVLLDDRPRLLGALAERADAVIWAGRPGPFGGEAIADLLAGRMNPSGRLPFTYPRVPAELVSYDHGWAERLGRGYGLVRPLRFDGFDPLWPLGHGLSYSTFSYSNLSVHPRALQPDGLLEVAVDVRNEGPYDGEHVLIVWVQDRYASLAPAVERVRAFDRLALGPGESQTVTMRIPVRDLGFHAPGEWRLEPGVFRVRIGRLEAEVTLERGETRRVAMLGI